jgi:hypothetical protein
MATTKGIDLVLRAIDLALDRRKVALAFAGIVAIGLVFGLFFLLSTAIGSEEEVLGIVVLILGLLVVWVMGALFSGAIAWLAWTDLNGQPGLSAGAALGYAGGRLASFLLAPLSLGLIGLAVLLVETLVLLLGRIPYAGELLAGLLYLPLVVINILVALMIYMGGWLVYPAVIEADRGVVDTVRQVIRTVRSAAGRIVSYFILAILVMVLAIVVLASLAAAGFSVTNAVMTAGVSPEKMLGIHSSAITGPLADLLGPIPGLGSSFGLRSLPATYRIAGVLMSLGNGILFGGILLVFPWTFMMTVSCAVYYTVRGSAPAAAGQPAPMRTAPAPAQAMPLPAWPQPAPPMPAPQPPQPVQQPYQAWPAPAGAPVCPKCGRQVRPGARFCQQCGATLGPAGGKPWNPMT